MVSTKNTARKEYGPRQFPERLGIAVWQFERALWAGLIPPADPATGRWTASVVDTALAQVEQIQTAVGSQPDVGASRAAEVLSGRFGIVVDPDVLIELDRMGLINAGRRLRGLPYLRRPRAGVVRRPRRREPGHHQRRLLTRAEVVEYLRVRRSDVEHLVRAEWLEPITWVRSGWQRRRENPRVPLFRVADLDVLLAHPVIDWDEVRATPAGKPSPLAKLTTRSDPGPRAAS